MRYSSIITLDRNTCVPDCIDLRALVEGHVTWIVVHLLRFPHDIRHGADAPPERTRLLYTPLAAIFGSALASRAYAPNQAPIAAQVSRFECILAVAAVAVVPVRPLLMLAAGLGLCLGIRCRTALGQVLRLCILLAACLGL